MSESEQSSLHDRVLKLEQAVQELRAQFASGASPYAPDSETLQSTHRGRGLERKPSPKNEFKLPDALSQLFAGKGESLLNRLGIGLLLLGVGFLFKYSIDRGWITELVRVLFGAGLGISLLAMGLRIADKRPLQAPILKGGGIAVLYGTTYAASNLYGLMGPTEAFEAALGITALAFLISIYQRESSLSVVGTLGGMLAPFLLNAAEPNLIGISVYASLIVAGTAATYLFHGWRLPLLAAFILVWPLLIGAFSEASLLDVVPDSGRLAIQAGLLVSWIAFGWCPVLRERLHRRDPDRWPLPAPNKSSTSEFIRRPALILAVVTPLILLAQSAFIWTWPNVRWGWISLAMAVGYGAIAHVLSGESPSERRLVQSHWVATALLLSIGVVLLFEGPWLVLAIALEGALLAFAAHQLEDRAIERIGYLAYGFAAVLMLGHAFGRSSDLIPVFNPESIACIAALMVIAVHVRARKNDDRRRAQAVAVHLLFLIWIHAEFGTLPGGQATVTIAWGSYAVTLFVLGLRSGSNGIRLAGLLTLLLTIGKLLAFDLATLDAVWRILLFLGFGTSLLLVSYFMPDIWKTASRPKETVEVG